MPEYLATPTDVKDRMSNMGGVSLPPGMTEPRIKDAIEVAHGQVMTWFGESDQADLTKNQRLVGKDATIKVTMADLLLAAGYNEAKAKTAAHLRKTAKENVEEARTDESTTKRLRGSLV